MTKLSTEQLIYLLYSSAYIEQDTVTKSTVKSYLSSEHKKKADSLYEALKAAGFIKPASKKGRFSVTEEGVEALVMNLAVTDYQFDSVKGPKVLNALLSCIGKTAKVSPQAELSGEMTFDEFQEKFKNLYFEERRQQELKGVVAIHSQKICQKFIQQNSISQDTLNRYFELLKSTGQIFSAHEKGHELIQWVE